MVEGDERKFNEALRPDIRTIILNSGGGDVRAGLAIGRRIRAGKLDVIVDGVCGSSCANYLFVAGNRQTVRPESVVLWHGGINKKLIRHMTDQVRRGMSGAPNEQVDSVARSIAAEWTMVLEDQRQFYREMGLPLVLLEGQSEFDSDIRSVDGARSGTQTFVFIGYAALRCAGLTGLQEWWTPPSEGWWQSFAQAVSTKMKHSFGRSPKLERRLCRSTS
jgi:hypothetical protein